MGPGALTLTECQVFPDTFSYHLCTRSSSSVFSLLLLSRRSRTFCPVCNIPFLSDDDNENVFHWFWNCWFFKKFCNTKRYPTKCNLDVVSQQQKACILRTDCASSSSCQKWRIGWPVSSPRSVNGQVFAKLGHWIQHASLHGWDKPLPHYL